MKVKFAILLLFLLTVTGLTFATNKKDVTLLEPVTVAGTVLQPGAYVIEWSGTDSEVQVTFWQGKNKLATAQAKLVATSSRFDAVTIKPEDSGTNRLIEIDSRNSALRFTESATSGE